MGTYELTLPDALRLVEIYQEHTAQNKANRKPFYLVFL